MRAAAVFSANDWRCMGRGAAGALVDYFEAGQVDRIVMLGLGQFMTGCCPRVAAYRSNRLVSA